MFKIVIVLSQNTVFESWPFTWHCPNFMGFFKIRSVIFTWVMVAFLHSPLGIKGTDVKLSHSGKLNADIQNCWSKAKIAMPIEDRIISTNCWIRNYSLIIFENLFSLLLYFRILFLLSFPFFWPFFSFFNLKILFLCPLSFESLNCTQTLLFVSKALL